jgi:hypothetical protein
MGDLAFGRSSGIKVLVGNALKVVCRSITDHV